jgi:hypothetical protein
MDFFNPYPTAVKNLRNIYRQYFPAALPYLENYLQYSGIYKDMIGGRLQQINDRLGCRAHF